MAIFYRGLALLFNHVVTVGVSVGFVNDGMPLEI